MVDTALLEEVQRFAADKLGLRFAKLRPEHSLLHDWNVSGLDGVGFMLAFAKKFHVDISGFDLGRYFGDEPPPLFRSRPELARIPRLTFIDLSRAAREHVWKEHQGAVTL